MNVQLANAWGIVRAIIDICRKRPEGKYVLVKVPPLPPHFFWKILMGPFRIPTNLFYDSTTFLKMTTS